MSRIPIFIEVTKQTDAQLCRTVVDTLLQQIQPIGLATSMAELNDILATLKQNNLSPAIFVINTFEAREIVPQLDPLMGDLPAIFMRRGMYAGRSGLMEHFPEDPNKMATMAVLKKLTPRLTSIWTYGTKNAAQVTLRMIQCMQRYHADGNFRHFELAAKLS
jgi:hypothetical protein